MATTLTPNKGLYKVTVGTELGTWGPFLNTNEDTLDNALGGVTTIALTNVNLVLSPAQYANTFIFFTGTLTGDVTISFPDIGSFYTIVNQTDFLPASFVVRLKVDGFPTVICAPPGDAFPIITYPGGGIKACNLPPVGTYLDLAYADVPRWISQWTAPPWLYCNGAAFSAVTYPNLFSLLGIAVLPDMRGRMRAAFNNGTGRITAASGVDGDTLFTGGGASTLVTAGTGGTTALHQLPPICIGGVTLIRAC